MAFLGIDIGTSGCKVLALGPEGVILASHTVPYGFDQPRPGWTEQDPALWIAGARNGIAEVLKSVPAAEIAAVGLSAQMHGLTPVDRAGKVIRPALLWNDQRNAAEAAEIEALAGGADALLAMTNNRMLVGYTGGKILWLQRHEPSAFARISKVLNPKDYLRFVLTGEMVTEVSDASGTGLFDTRARAWSRALLERLPFDADLLPACHESAEITGEITPAAAAAFGLPAGLPVIGGGGDAVIQTLGSGVVRPGILQTTIGTAGNVATALEAPGDNPEGRLQVFCNLAPDLWHCMGVSLNAGGAFGWLRATLGGTTDFATLIAGAQEVPPGAQGLLFLPYLNGERCPYPDPLTRGAFVGLTARHDARHMTRAVLEGVAFSMYDMAQLMARTGFSSDLATLSGGGARAPLWRQIHSDLLNCPVITTEGAAEGGAYGAALLAGVSLGAWSDLAEAADLCRELTRETPDPARGAIYRESHALYAKLYETLKPVNDALSAREAETGA